MSRVHAELSPSWRSGNQADVSPVWTERELTDGRGKTAAAHLIVSVHHLKASAGLVLLHIAKGTLQTEDHVVSLLNHLHRQKPRRYCRKQTLNISYY